MEAGKSRVDEVEEQTEALNEGEDGDPATKGSIQKLGFDFSLVFMQQETREEEEKGREV